MGEVYRASDTKLNRDVVLVMSPYPTSVVYTVRRDEVYVVRILHGAVAVIGCL